MTTATQPMHEYDVLRNLRTLGSLLDDLEAVRVMNANRVGALQRSTGAALPALDVISGQVAAVEHSAELELVRMWRRHPLAPWAAEYRGLGEKSIARLIAVIGDPAVRTLGHWGEGREWIIDGYEPRTLAQLRSYCGHGSPERVKRKGMTQAELMQMGNPRAKKQTWLISTSLLKAGNRAVYDEARAKYADAVHERACVRCGPAGRPAAVGTPLSAAHQHARALRATGKAFLADLWDAAHEVHV